VDVDGSRLRPVEFPILGWELLRIFFALNRLRWSAGSTPLLGASASAVADIQKDVG